MRKSETFTRPVTLWSRRGRYSTRVTWHQVEIPRVSTPLMNARSVEPSFPGLAVQLASTGEHSEGRPHIFHIIARTAHRALSWSIFNPSCVRASARVRTLHSALLLTRCPNLRRPLCIPMYRHDLASYLFGRESRPSLRTCTDNPRKTNHSDFRLDLHLL